MSKEQTIRDFLTEMSSQDPRGTAFPYYYVILDYKTEIRESADGEERYVGDDELYTREEALEYGYSEEELENKITIYVEEVETEKEIGMFLTESDAKKHLEANKHRYSDKAHTYVKHCFRAPQLKHFLESLFEHFDVPLPPDLYYKAEKGGAECQK